MKLHTKAWAGLLTAILFCLSGVVNAQTKEWAPTKTVKIIVPITGSTNDVLARIIAPRLQEALGQPVIVENKPGAGGNIGANEVAKATPDGHMLLVGYNGPLAINVSLFDKMPYDPLKDLAPITLVVRTPQYLVVSTASGITSVKDLVAKAKAEPNKYSYGSVALGSASHLTMEMFKNAAGFNMIHVPYRGAGPAISDLIGGNIQAGFFVPGNVLQFVKEGRLRLLASTGVKRFAGTPDVPTIAELGYKDFEAQSWIGFLTTGGAPQAAVDRYHKEITKIVQTPEVRKQLTDMEFEIVSSTPQQFSDWIRSEIIRWARVIKVNNVKAE